MAQGGGFQVKDAENVSYQQKKFEPGEVTGADASYFADEFFSQELGYEAVYQGIGGTNLTSGKSALAMSQNVDELNRRMNLRKTDREMAQAAQAARRNESKQAASTNTDVAQRIIQAANSTDEDLLGLA